MTHRFLIMELDIRLFTPQSLKEKRSVKNALIDKLKGEFNISIAETLCQDQWQRIGLSLAHVALNERCADRTANLIRKRCDELLEGEGEVLSFLTDIF
ncbi:MAG: DUF503 domain-containing protein [Eubacteriaceae bacterium]|jgi:uncharacterized protein YlxP (DUF503 family)|nr:DUF503 domain-containing protein [Eubacteriaceae bacterium]